MCDLALVHALESVEPHQREEMRQMLTEPPTASQLPAEQYRLRKALGVL